MTTPESPSPSRRNALALAGLGLAGGVLALGSRAAGTDQAPEGAAKPLLIAIHVSDADHWGPTFSNLKNLTAMRPDAKLRVIVDGPAVYVLPGTTDLSPMFQKFSGLGVEFQACNNALTEKKIGPASLPAYIQVVPAAVIALAEAQYAGYAYIKP